MFRVVNKAGGLSLRAKTSTQGRVDLGKRNIHRSAREGTLKSMETRDPLNKNGFQNYGERRSSTKTLSWRGVLQESPVGADKKKV